MNTPCNNNSSMSLVWFITGASQATGLGREIALTVLARGDKVILAVRFQESVHLRCLQESYPNACSIVQMNVADNFDMIFEKAREAVAVWGRVDVVVNNAGDYYWGNIEELGSDGFRGVYNTNVFGTINVVNAFLPHMRTRRSGTLIFIGSRSAWRSLATTSSYASSKAAVHAISDILAVELKELNIRVLNVVPGGMRTGAMSRIRYPHNPSLPYESDGGKFTEKEVPEYAETRAKIAELVKKGNGSEPGDPKKAANVITDVVRGEGLAIGRTWPGTLYLGSDGENQIREKYAEIMKTLGEWSDVVRSINFDEAAVENS